MFEPLLGYDSGTKLVPLLASDMPTVSADGKAYTFKLRTGVNFVNPDGSVAGCSQRSSAARAERWW